MAFWWSSLSTRILISRHDNTTIPLKHRDTRCPAPCLPVTPFTPLPCRGTVSMVLWPAYKRSTWVAIVSLWLYQISSLLECVCKYVQGKISSRSSKWILRDSLFLNSRLYDDLGERFDFKIICPRLQKNTDSRLVGAVWRRGTLLVYPILCHYSTFVNIFRSISSGIRNGRFQSCCTSSTATLLLST